MTWYLIQIALMLFVTQLILGPIALYFTSKQSANPRFTTFAPENPPIRLPNSYMQNLAVLESLGFTVVAHLFSAAISPTLRLVMTVYVNRREQETATVVHMLAEVPPATRTLHTYTEFCTEFEDGLELNTGNSSTAPFFVRVPEKQIFRLPHLNDVAHLYRVHQALTNRRFGANKRIAAPRQEVAEIIEVMKGDLEREAIYGRLRLDKTGEWYRPTMRGAIYGILTLIWPVGMLRRMAQRRRGIRLAEEVMANTYAAE